MTFITTATELPGVLVFEPRVYPDDRGHFFESFNLRDFRAEVGHDVNFVQDNQSLSKQGVVRGLHYQIEHPQGKLVRVLQGAIFDVAVDVRRSSPSFGKWAGVMLSAENMKQLWVPEGFAHGFLVIDGPASVAYKTTDYWYSQHERSLLWNDPALGISWPKMTAAHLSAKDAEAPLLAASSTLA